MKNLQVFWAENAIEERNIIRAVFNAHFSHINLVFFSNGAILLIALEDAAFLDQTPNLIVADLNMPDFDGRYVLRHISRHKKLQKVPIVLFSGTSNSMDKFYLSFFHVKRYYKPAEPEEYKKVIQKIIEDHFSDETKD